MHEYIKNELKNSDIVVLDLEALNYTKEAISIGAVIISYNEEQQCFKVNKKSTFKRLIKPQSKNRVDKVIENLTGITNAMLKEKGVTFIDCMNDFHNYYSTLKNPLFLCHGNFDEIILKSSFKRSNNKELMKQYKFISSRLIDYSKVISTILRYKNTISLINAVTELDLQQNGKHHDALNDAIDLANVFVKVENDNELCINKTIDVYIKNFPKCTPFFVEIKYILSKQKVFKIENFNNCPDNHLIKELINRLYLLNLIDNEQYKDFNKIKSDKDKLHEFLFSPTNKNNFLILLENKKIDTKTLRKNKKSFEENILYLKTIKNYAPKRDKEMLLALLLFNIADYYVNDPIYKGKLQTEVTEELVEKILVAFDFTSKTRKNIKFYINSLNMKKLSVQKLENLKSNCNNPERYKNIINMYKAILQTKRRLLQDEIKDLDKNLSLIRK